MEVIPEDDFLKEGEIALSNEGNHILGLTFSSPDKLLESYGLRYLGCYKGDEFNMIYEDGYGNGLLLRCNQTFIQSGNVLISGIQIDYSLLYEDSSGSREKIDLWKYVEHYPKNVFSEVVQRIKRKLVRKRKRRKLIYI